MKNNLQVTGLFPVPVGMLQYTVPFTLKQRKTLKELESDTRQNVGNNTSKEAFVLDREEFLEHKENFTYIVNQFFNYVYNPSNDIQVYITQSWVNVTQPGQFHHTHSHPNSFISGVLYLDVEEEKDLIIFHKPQRNHPMLVIPYKEPNEFNSETSFFNVNNHMLVLFPSTLPHDVPQTESTRPRVSLSFNTFLKGNLGEPYNLTHLVL